MKLKGDFSEKNGVYLDLNEFEQAFFIGCSEAYLKSHLGEEDQYASLEDYYVLTYGDVDYTLALPEDLVSGIRVGGETASHYFSNFTNIREVFNPDPVYALYYEEFAQDDYGYTLVMTGDKPITFSFYSDNESGSPLRGLSIEYEFYHDNR